MSPRARSYLLLAATLLIGTVLGALVLGAVGHLRSGRIEGMRHEEAFVRDLQRLIRPHDEQQRQTLRPILEETARRNAATMREFNDRMRQGLQEMIEELAPHLDADQLERLRRFAERPPPPGGPPPGGPPPRGRGNGRPPRRGPR